MSEYNNLDKLLLIKSRNLLNFMKQNSISEGTQIQTIQLFNFINIYLSSIETMIDNYSLIYKNITITLNW